MTSPIEWFFAHITGIWMPVTRQNFMFMQRTLLKKQEKYHDKHNMKRKKNVFESKV
jgi:hypothetical protein